MQRLWMFALVMVSLLSISTVSLQAEDLPIDFEEVFDCHGSIMLIIHAETGAIYYANQAAEDFYGYEDLTAMSIDTINQLSAEEIYQERQAAQNEERNYFVFKHVLNNGDVRTVEVRSYAFEMAGESYLYSIVNDITALNQAQRRNTIFATVLFVLLIGGLIGALISYFNAQKLKRKSENNKVELETVLEATHTGIWHYDFHAQKLKANATLFNILGIENNDHNMISLATWCEYIHEEDREFFEQHMHQLIEGEVSQIQLQVRAFKANPHLIWLSITGEATYQNDGESKQISGLVTDITSQKETEEALTHSHDLMDYVIEHNNAAVAIHDKDLNYIYVSKNYLEQFNVKESDIIGKHHYAVFPDLPQKWRDIHQKVLNGEVHRNDKDPFPRADGTTDWTRWEARPWYENDGSIGGLIIYTEVINDQIEAEETLKSQAEILHQQTQEAKATLMAIGDGVISTDNQGIITAFNAVSAEITEWSQEEAIGKPFKDIFNIYSEATKQTVHDPVERVLKTKARVDLENHTILVTKNHHERHIEDSATPIYDEAKNIIGVVLVFRDVSEKVKLTKELNQETQRLSRVVASTADIIFEIDKEKHFVSIYGKGLDKIEHDPEDILGKTVIDVFGDDGQPRDKAYDEALNGHVSRYEWRYKTTQDKIIYFESSISPMYDEFDHVIGAVGISRDITETKMKQKEIEFLSFHDHLTGLYNRRYLAETLAKMDDTKHYPLAVMMIDLNGLKILNDAYGHEVGDQALVKVAKILKQESKTSDTVARIGGDEFAIIRDHTDKNQMDELKDRLIKAIAALIIYNVNLSIAVGYDIKESDDTAIGEVMKNAEDMMYKRKLSEGISARNQTIRAIMKTLTDKYEEEKIHSERVAAYAKKLGEALKLHDDLLNELEMAALFHDIGKISLPDEILRKPGKLTKEEFDIIKKHTENGYQILRAADQYSDLAEHALYHHERIDGNGYPHGLKGDDIPLVSRIICIADAYEAMRSERPYAKALQKDEAIKELKTHAGSQFDPTLVDVFIKDVIAKGKSL